MEEKNLYFMDAKSELCGQVARFLSYQKNSDFVRGQKLSMSQRTWQITMFTLLALSWFT